MIIDFHTHVFPPKIAERAVASLAAQIKIKPYASGTLEGLKKTMEEAGIDYSVILPVVTKPEQFKTVNEYAAKITGKGGIISFGGLHPKTKNMKQEIDRICELGLLGIKLHPDFQDMYIDEQPYIELITYACQKGLIITIHAGMDEHAPQQVYCSPVRILNMLETVEKNAETSKIVLAHMGGLKLWDDVIRYLAGKDIYLDTSYCPKILEKDTFVELIRKHGSERILFGSDSPWDDQKSAVTFIKNLDISNDEKANILYGNASKLLFK